MSHFSRAAINSCVLLCCALGAQSWSPIAADPIKTIKASTPKKSSAKPVVMVTTVPNKNAIHVTFYNNSSGAIKMSEFMVPWKHRGNIILTAVVPVVDGWTLPKNLMIDDPGPAITTIKPGETLSGDINLDSRFPDLKRARMKNDVIIFWSYQLKSMDFKEIKRFPREGGWLLLSRHQ
jgi:hypothetical protein